MMWVLSGLPYLDCFESYLDCLSKLYALILDTEAIHTLIVGDFNCSPGSKFFPQFVKFYVELVNIWLESSAWCGHLH